MTKKKTFFEIKATSNGKTGEIYILGEITKYAWEEYGEMSSVLFKEKLDELGDVDVINLYVNSGGGSVFEGIAIGNMLKQHKAKVIGHVVALAASIASDIIASCDEVRMPENAKLMIHNAMSYVWGNSAEMRKTADDLDLINDMQVVTYMAKIGDKTSEEEIRRMMDEETWLSAQEAYDIGLCDVVESSVDAVACLSDEHKKQFKKLPQAFRQSSTDVISEEERQAILADSKANLIYINQFI